MKYLLSFAALILIAGGTSDSPEQKSININITSPPSASPPHADPSKSRLIESLIISAGAVLAAGIPVWSGIRSKRKSGHA
jgi:hypothetical protein